MNFIVRTAVPNARKENVLANFGRSMFLRLVPPFPKLKLFRFDGCETKDEIHLELDFIFYSKKWISLVTTNGRKENELYFIDEGTILPPPLTFWKHYHGIHQEGTNVVIEDNVTYKSWNKILDILLYPFFYAIFYYRKPIYRKYLSGLNNNLIIPSRLYELIEAGIWPKLPQNIYPAIKKEVIQKFAPEEHEINLHAPPFKTVQEDFSTGEYFWNTYGALDQIDPSLAILIGDFGIGADTCLILDYRENRTKPKVLRLVFSDTNYWTKVSDSFEEFCDLCGLTT